MGRSKMQAFHTAPQTTPISLSRLNLILVLFTSPSSSMMFSDGIADRYYCPQNWALLQNTATFEVHCFQKASALPFHQASKHCHSQYANVLSSLNFHLLTTSKNNLTRFLSENGVGETWFGYYVQDGRLRRDRFPLPPTYQEEMGSWFAQQQTSLHMPWAIGEPSGDGECVKLVISRAACHDLFNDTTDAPTGQSETLQQHRKKRSSGLKWRLRKRQTVSVCDTGVMARAQTVPCDVSLPFVCVKPAFDTFTLYSLHAPEICRPGESGMYHLPVCISVDKESVTFKQAEEKCLERVSLSGRGSLYNARGTFSDVINSFIIRGVMTENGDALAWVARDKTNSCQAIAVTYDPPVTLSWDCGARLPGYLCEHTAVIPETPTLQLNIAPEELLHIEKIPGCDDIQVSVSSSTELISRLRMSCVADGPLVPEIQNMTLLKGGVALESLWPGASNISAALPLYSPFDAYAHSYEYTFTYPDVLTEYYWCEMNDLTSGTIRKSRRIFLRIRGTEIYAASIVINTTSDLRAGLVTYSMSGIGEEQVLDALQPLQPWTTAGTQYKVRWLRFRPFRSSESSNKTAMTQADFYVMTEGLNPAIGSRPVNVSIPMVESVIRNVILKAGNSSLFIQQTLQVRSLDFCPFQVLHDPIGGKSWNVPDTPLGESFLSSDVCLANTVPYVKLDCVGDRWFGAMWSGFVPNQACNFTSEKQSDGSPTLRNISLSDINTTNVARKVDETKATLTQTPVLQAVDVVYLADILQKSTSSQDIPADTGRKLLDIVHTVTTLSNNVLARSDEIGNATNRIIQALDRVGDCLAVGTNARVRLVTDSIGLEVWNLNGSASDFTLGLELQTDGDQPAAVVADHKLVTLFEAWSRDYRLIDTAILLPSLFVKNLTEENADRSVKLSLSIFANTALFARGRLGRNNNASLNTKVISAKMTLDGAPVTHLSGFNVSTAYIPTTKLSDQTRVQNSVCVFWDLLEGEGRGGWSSEGCQFHSLVQGRDICVCDHLTNFAVLLDFYGQEQLLEEQQLPLTIISIIGLSLSIAGLSVTVLSFFLIKKLRQGRPQQTLFNMALAMLAAWIVFLAGIERVENRAGCIAVAVLLHYFILVSFMWMLMEGILQYFLFIKVLGVSFHRYLLKTTLPAWGLPLIPVIVVLAVDPNLYVGGDLYCWMALTPFYFAFLLPIGLIVLTNLVIYCMVVIAICRRRNVGSGSVQSSASQRVVGIRASVACFVVLGLSWIFAFFAVQDARVVFQYLFTISTTLQGLLIFAIFTARDPAVRAFWREKCCSRGDKPAASTAQARTGNKSATGSTETPLSHANTSDTDLDVLHRPLNGCSNDRSSSVTGSDNRGMPFPDRI